MKTLDELLASKGREVMAPNTLAALSARGEIISPLVAVAHTEAREQLGAGASDDALALRAATLLLKRLGFLPRKQTNQPRQPGSVAADAQPLPGTVADEQPGHFTQPVEG